MRFWLIHNKNYLMAFLSGVVWLLSSALINTAYAVSPQQVTSQQLSSVQAKTIIESKANKVLLYLKTNNLSQLARLVHPQQGVRFSPYGFVQPQDLIFNRAALPLLKRSQKLYHWGDYDGSGEPIQFSYKAYYQKFVFDRDFSQAKEILYNQSVQRGNSINNAQTFYPNSIVVEYYLPATTADNMDWRSLKLVFQSYNKNWYLVGIVHDQWTI